jgi:hypothetical protein
MTNIRSIDMLLLDDIFEMGGGYVLSFSDRTFAQFFREELNVDIDDPKYRVGGTSKGKRLRHFLQTMDKPTVVKALRALWEYREVARKRSGKEETLKEPYADLCKIIAKLEGNASPTQPEVRPATSVESTKFKAFRDDLLKLTALEPVPRGYAFEGFLKGVFDAFGLKAREAFRLRGEQIDGSFVLNNETYLLEAKWQNPLCGNAELHAFHGKIEQKAAWARGLFISYSGFTDDGLHAFGRGKRVICMDGWDLSEALQREIPLGEVLDRKVRRAAETGMALVRVRDLFG